ncbi:MAG: hypothetical protein K9N40_04360 [Candidatus Cloacimonetes bacterium]|nr:hypothetical protein [Candidatus Cloacimonadota bacterium]
MKKIILFATILVIISCSHFNNISEPYRNTVIENKSLAISQFDIKLDVDESYLKFFQNGDVKKNVIDYVMFTFNDNFMNTSTFKTVEIVDIDKSDFENRSYKAKDEFEMLTPINGSTVKSNSTYDFVMIIQDFEIHSKEGSSSSGVYSGGSWSGGGNFPPTINAKFKYLIWDNNNKQIVLFGESSSIAAITSEDESPWFELVSKASRKTIKKTPFDKYPNMMY